MRYPTTDQFQKPESLSGESLTSVAAQAALAGVLLALVIIIGALAGEVSRARTRDECVSRVREISALSLASALCAGKRGRNAKD